MPTPKRILIIGGSGRTGKLVISHALSHNHTITALVRKPEALSTEKNTNLRIITGTPTNLTDVRTAFAHSNPDVIIVTLSAPRASDSPFAAVTSPPRLMADSVSNLVRVMRENPQVACKIVVMQAFGAGASWGNLHCVLRVLMKNSNMRFQYEDHDAVARETEASGVPYVFVRPARLVEGGDGGGEKEVKVWEGDGKGVPIMAGITRASVAEFLVEVAEGNRWDGGAPVISN